MDTFKTPAYPADHAHLFDFGADWNTHQYVRLRSNVFEYTIETWNGNGVTGSTVSSNTIPTLNQWHHVAISYDSQTQMCTLYLDGVNVGSGTLGLEPNALAGYGTNYLGRSQEYNNNEYFDGQIDEFRYWPWARTQQEIQSTMFCRPACPGDLLLYFPFEDGIAGGNNTGLTHTTDYTLSMTDGELKNYDLNGGNSNFISGAKTLMVNGPVEFCPSTSITYSIPVISGATNYNWTFPNGWSQTGGSNQEAIVTSGAQGGTISCEVTLPCGDITYTLVVAPYLSGVPASVENSGALDLDGVDDYVEITHADHLNLGNDFTWEFWLKTCEDSGWKYIIRKSGAYGIDLINGTDLLFVTWGDDAWFNGAVLNDNQWHHYALTASGGNEKKVYRDGQLLGTNTSSYATNVSNNSLYIGYTFSSVDFTIDEFRIWNKTRSESEVRSDMLCRPGCSADLVAYFPFEDGTPNGDNTVLTNVKDHSLYGNDGILNFFDMDGDTSNLVAEEKVRLMGWNNVCAGEVATYSIPDVYYGATYQWSLPTGWTGSSSTSSISTTPNSNGGAVEVTVTPACGPVFTRSIQVLSGNCSSGLDLGGSNDYVNLGTGLGNFGTNDFTIEAWLNTSSQSSRSFISKRGVCGCDNFWNLSVLNTGQIRFEGYGDNGCGSPSVFNSNGVVNDGVWHHVAVVRSGSVFSIYIDGKLDICRDIGYITSFSNQAEVHLGENACNNFVGMLDEVRFWNMARSTQDIMAHYQCELAGCEPGLLAYYNMNGGIPGGDNAGATLADNSGNGHTGAFVGMTLDGNSSNFVTANNGLIGGCQTPGIDTDGDGICDATDPDDDNDGVADGADVDPLDPFLCADSDQDGCDDCSIGVDGFGPLADNTPNNDGTDTDSDGLCDAYDQDDDNDGVLDVNDPQPLNPDVCGDSNQDGCDDCAIGTDNFGPQLDKMPDNDGCNDGPACPDTLTITGPLVQSFYQAGDIITTDNLTTLANGDTTEIKAGISVTLLPGVHLQEGSTVRIYIEGCPQAIQEDPVVRTMIEQGDEQLQSRLADVRLVVQPNPFRSSALITYDLPEVSQVELTLYAPSGAGIATLVPEQVQDSGRYTYELSSSSLTSGLYYLVLRVDGKTLVKKVAITK